MHRLELDKNSSMQGPIYVCEIDVRQLEGSGAESSALC